MYDRDKWSRQEYNREDRVGYSGQDQWGPYTGNDNKPDRSRRGAYDRERDKAPKRQHEKPKKEGENEEPKETEKDSFWDTKWDAMQLTEKIEKAEKKGRYYLNTKKRFKDATGDADDSPSLSPSPERSGKKKKKYSDSESDTEELKTMKKLKDIENCVVDGDGLVEGAPVDSSNYEYDKVTKMYRKKDGLVNLEKKNFENKFEKDKEKSKGKGESKKEKGTSADSEDELVKDIEDLENEAKKAESKPSEKEADKIEDKPSIDWGDSALAHLKDEKDETPIDEKHAKNLKKSDEIIESLLKQKKKKDKKVKKEKDDSDSLEEGEVNEGKEGGEVEDSDDSRKKSKRSRSRSKGRHRSSSYSRDRRSRSVHRTSYSRRDDRRSPYDRRDNYRRGHYQRDRDDRGYRGSYGRDRDSYGRRSRYRSRSKSRDRYREPDRYELNKQRQEKHLRSKINKEKLLEIAKKNAAKILKSGGDLMGMDQDRLIAMKSGGQNLDELTKFCKELAKKGLEDKNRIELLAESESEEEEFHHPFMVKDRPLPNPISMLIGEPRETLPPVARAVAKSQRMLEFPVSSGNAHRVKEVTVDPLGDWKPVEKDERKALTMEVDEDEMLKMHEQIEAEDAALAKAAEENKDEEDMPWKLTEAEKANIINPLGVVMFGGIKDLPEEKKEEVEKLKPKPAPAPPLALAAPAERLALAAPSSSGTSAGTLVQHKLSENPDKVFDTTEAPVVDIGTIISNRLNAMRKLQESPNDASALQEMYNAQKQMSSWATSKNKPGQFVGSTGARVLSHHELNLGLQCWARKDQFTNAAKVSGGFGEFLLKKMGWSDGDGLGKHRNGTVDPLILDIKFDKKGLMAEEENRRGKVVTMTGCKDLSSKHPVSALMELCSKRRWGPPTFEQAFECGPPHKKQYVFKVTVDGKEYMPTVAVDNKKKAKSNAAMAALQQMGLLAKDPDNPV